MTPFRAALAALLAIASSYPQLASGQAITPPTIARGYVTQQIPTQNNSLTAASVVYADEPVYYVAEAARPVVAGRHILTYRWYLGETQLLEASRLESIHRDHARWWVVLPAGRATPGAGRIEVLIDGGAADRITFSVARGARMPEQALREQIASNGADLLRDRRVDEFDALAKTYRDGRERTPAGEWKLRALYQAIPKAAPSDPNSDAWMDLEETTRSWLRRSPKSATATVVSAKVLYAHAWAYRGLGANQDVNAESNRSFHRLLEQAESVLESHADVAATDPEWWVERIAVAKSRADGPARVFEMAKSALANFPTYTAIHYAAIDGLQSRWGGSDQWIRNYVALALAASHDDEGAQAYFRIYARIASESSEPIQAIRTTGAQQPLMIDSGEQILRSYPDPFNLQWARTMDCLIGNPAAYRALPRRGPVEVPLLTPWDSAEWRTQCDDQLIDGVMHREPADQMIFHFYQFLGGMTDDLWRNARLSIIGLWLVMELCLRLLARSGRRSQLSLQAVMGAAPEFDSTLYPRRYRLATQKLPLSNRGTIRLGVLAGTAAWAVRSVPWVDVQLDTIEFGVLLAISAGCVLIISGRMSACLVLRHDRLEIRTLIRRRQIRRDAILYRDCSRPDGTRNVALFAVRSEPPALVVPPVYGADGAYWIWLASLPARPSFEADQNDAGSAAAETVRVRQMRAGRNPNPPG